MPNDIPERSNGESNLTAEITKPAMGNEPPSPARIDWRGVNLRGASMSGVNLEHADFRAADLQNVNFTGSLLRYADFRGANIRGANFQQASLYGAKMQGAEAFGANFRQADLRQANFAGAYLEGAMFPTPSPGELAEAQGPLGKSWKEQEIEQSVKAGQDSNADNDQNQQARGRSLPAEQRRQKRGQSP